MNLIRSHKSTYWIGLGVAALGGGWLVVLAAVISAQFAQRGGVSTWLAAQSACAGGLIIGGFVVMAGSSTFAAGQAVEFDRLRDFGEQPPNESDVEVPAASADEPEFDEHESTGRVEPADAFRPPKPFIMVRCRRCETLNSEHRNTCTQCEHPI